MQVTGGRAIRGSIVVISPENTAHVVGVRTVSTRDVDVKVSSDGHERISGQTRRKLRRILPDHVDIGVVVKCTTLQVWLVDREHAFYTKHNSCIGKIAMHHSVLDTKCALYIERFKPLKMTLSRSGQNTRRE